MAPTFVPSIHLRPQLSHHPLRRPSTHRSKSPFRRYTPITSQTPRTPAVGSPQPPRPTWLRVSSPNQTTFPSLQRHIHNSSLHTVCEEARCPNIGECWNGGTATIMLLGDTCTRGCRFCSVKTSQNPGVVDAQEPWRVATEVKRSGLKYVVLTSVDRDDLHDGGAGHFARTVELIKLLGGVMVECLVSDFKGDESCVDVLAGSDLDVYAHNVETVERLQRYVRDPRAGYEQSMKVLERAKKSGVFTKTSLMLGLGETDVEIRQTLKDLRSVGVDVVTFGQYLRPTERHLSVVEYVTPEKFEMWKRVGEDMGFRYVASGPMVRSSYKAGEFFMSNMIDDDREGRRVKAAAAI